MGVFGVFGSEEGVREMMNMQNTPLWACFACLECGVGREMFLVIATALWVALGLCLMPRVMVAMGLLASVVL